MSSERDNTTGDAPVSLLDRINVPGDLKSLSMDELRSLASEIRDRIIETASVYGGHLAPHLGVVELTLALHYVFDTERDRIIWDVGHQTYAHKLVTGRRDRFKTIRRKGGLSGYPRRSESPYDAFGVGHSSTSISAGLGMAVARDQRGDDNRVISVIGDGAMTGGMAFEALAHAGHVGTDLLVILNDNKMSISPNVGALSAYFSRLITGGVYSRAREDIGSFMKRMLGPQLTRAAHKLEQSVKGFITPGTMFQELGFKYVGPIDGHDLDTLIGCLGNVKGLHGPIFFHCVTQKGKGYSYAEEDPQTYHGVRAFDISTGKFDGTAAPPETAKPVVTFTQAFSDVLMEEAEKNPAICAITAAMATGTGLTPFERRYPERFFDVGICEQHAVTFAAGLAADGLRPVCAIYSTFFQRCYDQFIHDVCMQGLPVVFAMDRAGAVGEDSPTQQGAFDLTFLRSSPNVVVMAPRDAEDLKAMLRWALAQPIPAAIRYARSAAPLIGDTAGRDITRGEVLREGSDATLLGLGPLLGACLRAAEALEAEGLSVRVADARLVKPLDTELLDRIAGAPVITVEENTLDGGFGSAVLEHYADTARGEDTRILRLGFPDRFMDHATRDEQLAEIGLDAAGIAARVKAFLAQRVPGSAK